MTLVPAVHPSGPPPSAPRPSPPAPRGSERAPPWSPGQGIEFRVSVNPHHQAVSLWSGSTLTAVLAVWFSWFSRLRGPVPSPQGGAGLRKLPRLPAAGAPSWAGGPRAVWEAQEARALGSSAGDGLNSRPRRIPGKGPFVGRTHPLSEYFPAPTEQAQEGSRGAASSASNLHGLSRLPWSLFLSPQKQIAALGPGPGSALGGPRVRSPQAMRGTGVMWDPALRQFHPGLPSCPVWGQARSLQGRAPGSLAGAGPHRDPQESPCPSTVG